jgi:hypothetical protein
LKDESPPHERPLESIKQRFATKVYIFTAHGSDRAAKRLIKSAEIEETVAASELIEDYPDDMYGPSCLLMGVTQSGRILHIQVSYPDDIKIITVYEPKPDEWEEDWKTREAP